MQITDPILLAKIKQQQSAMGAPSMPEPQPFPSAIPSGTRIDPLAQSRENRAESKEDQLLPSQVSSAQTESEIKKLQLREARLKAGLDPETGKAASNGGTIGDGAIADLSPQEQNIVKGIVQGRVPVSSLALSRNPQLFKLVERAYQYEPGTDLTTFQRRSVAFNKFLSNPNSPMVRVNQALQHLDRFAENAKKLDNFHSSLLNPMNVGNYARAAYGSVNKTPEYEAFATDRDALATELAAAFQGSGQSALADREEWRKRLSAANSPESFDAAIKEAVGLLGGRIEASNAQFRQAVGPSGDAFDLMSPEARKVFEKYAPEAHVFEEGEKELSDTMKTIPIPKGYQQDHMAMLAHHTPGTLTVGQYIKMRQALDNKYSGEMNGARSHLDPDEVQKFVDDYNKGAHINKIPDINAPLSEEGIGGTGLFSEKDRAHAAMSPVGTAIVDATNAGTFGAVDLALGQEGREAKHAMEEAHPVASAFGDMAGSILPMAGLEKMGIITLKKLGVANPERFASIYFGKEGLKNGRGKAALDLGMNTLYGAERGAAGADEGQRGEGFVRGGAGGVVATVIGQGATKGLNPLLSDVTQEALGKMKGVKMTTLQRLGLGEEEASLSGVPFVAGARRNSIKSYNRDNANRALSYIGERVPKNLQPGTETNKFINERLDAAYNDIRPQIGGMRDKTFKDNYAVIKAAGSATKEKREMLKEIEAAHNMFFDEAGHFDGNGYKEASARLRHLTKTWSDKEGDVAASDMARLAEQTRKQMQQLISRSAPEVGKRLKAIERGWAHSVVIEDATNRALANNEGVYGPGQHLNSIKKLDTSVRKGMSARGKAFDQPYAEAAAKTMGPGSAPTKLSLKETGIVLGAIGAGSYAAPTVAPWVAGAAAGLYGPGVKRVVQGILAGQRPTAIDNALVRRSLEDYTRHSMTGN